MNINVTDTPNPQDEEYVIASLWAHNDKYAAVEIRPLFLTITNDTSQIVGELGEYAHKHTRYYLTKNL